VRPRAGTTLRARRARCELSFVWCGDETRGGRFGVGRCGLRRHAGVGARRGLAGVEPRQALARSPTGGKASETVHSETPSSLPSFAGARAAEAGSRALARNPSRLADCKRAARRTSPARLPLEVFRGGATRGCDLGDGRQAPGAAPNISSTVAGSVTGDLSKLSSRPRRVANKLSAPGTPRAPSEENSGRTRPGEYSRVRVETRGKSGASGVLVSSFLCAPSASSAPLR
jgi:hypothetical protein